MGWIGEPYPPNPSTNRKIFLPVPSSQTSEICHSEQVLKVAIWLRTNCPSWYSEYQQNVLRFPKPVKTGTDTGQEAWDPRLDTSWHIKQWQKWCRREELQSPESYAQVTPPMDFYLLSAPSPNSVKLAG